MDKQVSKALEEKYCEDLKKISRKDSLSINDIELSNYLINSLYKLQKMGEGDSGYSNRGSYGNWSAEGSYDGRINRTFGPNESYARSYNGSYADESAARGMRYVQGHYSHGDSKEMFMEHLEKMMDDPELNREQKESLMRAKESFRMR